MSLVVSCPRCGDEVTLPSGSVEDSLVRCPYCAEVYPLAEVQRVLPPALVVVGRVPSGRAGPTRGDDTDGPTIDLGSQPSDSQIHESDSLYEEFRLAPPVAEPRAFVASEASSASRPTPQKRSPSRTPTRRTSGGTFREIAKIVAGGIVGLTIGQLILWWMPGSWNHSNRDPAGIGAKIGEYVPWLVPLGVRGEPRAFTPRADDDPRPPTEFNSIRSPDETWEEAGGASGLDSFDFSDRDSRDGDSSRFRSLDADPFPLDEPDDLEQNTDAVGPDVPSPEDSSPLGESPSRDEAMAREEELPNNEDLTTEETLSDEPNRRDRTDESGDLDSSSTRATPATRATAVRQAPRYEPVQLSAVVEELRDALSGWSEDDPEMHAFVVYAALARTSMVVPFTDAAQAETRRAVALLRGYLSDIGRDAEKLQAVAEQARATRLAERSSQEGTFVSGVVQRVERRGRLFATTLQRDGAESVDIISTVDPEGRLPTGRHILALGITILDPREELLGYEGPAEPVLYGALVVTVSR